MVNTSARNAGDPWFESRSWYDRFLYVNIHLFIFMPVSCNSSILLKILNSDTVEPSVDLKRRKKKKKKKIR